MMYTKSFRYVLYNLGEHALIYEARLIDFHEYKNVTNADKK